MLTGDAGRPMPGVAPSAATDAATNPKGEIMQSKDYEGVAVRGHQLVWCVVRDGKVTTSPLSAGRRYQIRAARFAALRECWSWYRVVGTVTL